MKKYIIKLSIVISSFMLIATSCNSQLDLEPDGRTTYEEIFSNRNKTRGYLNACYNYGTNVDMHWSSFTDDAEDSSVSEGGGRKSWYDGDITVRTWGGPDYPWGGLFQGIRKCNVFIENIEGYNALSYYDEVEGWKAHAHTLRAYYYWMLAKRYGGLPLIEKAYGIEHDFSVDKKSDFSEIARFVIADCESALSAPDSETGFSWNIYEGQTAYMHRAVPYALMSQAATYAVSPLWNDGTMSYEEATKITGNALYECLTHDYRLFDITPSADIAQNAYAYYFLTNPNDRRSVDKETILHKSGTQNVWRDAGLPSNEGATTSGPCPTQELVDSYEMQNTGESVILGYTNNDHTQPIYNTSSGYDPKNPYQGRDPRFYASIYYNGAVRYLDQPNGRKVETYVGGQEGISDKNKRYSRTGYYLRKYNNHKSNLNTSSDGSPRLFRLAELYLNFAETANQSHGPDVQINIGGSMRMSAREAVNAVRKRAGMPDFPEDMTKEEFEKKYRNERRVEFAYEDHRFFDVRRWKILEATNNQATGMKITKSSGTEDFSYNRFRFKSRYCNTTKFLKYPIPESEVTKVLNHTGQNWQNEGW